MERPLISIIIPIYNVESYLEECLNSVQNQSYTNFEGILVNDGSTDNSVQICQTFVDSNPNRFKLVHKENGGLSDARNKGISHASGDYILFLDSDDYITPDALEKLVQAALYSDADIVCCGMIEVTEGGQKIRDIPANSKLPAGQYHFLQDPYLFAQSLPNACNKLIKTTLFNKHQIEFPRGLWYEDLATIPKLFFYANNINIISDGLYNYRYREGSITKTYSLKILDIFTILSMLTEFFDESAPDVTHLQNALKTLYVNHTIIALSRLVLVTDSNKIATLRLIKEQVNSAIPNIHNIFLNTTSPLKYKLLIASLKVCGIKFTYYSIRQLVAIGKIKP